ncbi:MAG: histidinol dehydrogenase [Dehalococcoidia bacterium]|nr:histidinol dehydrogenase [Dehalococcoidia bacterium]
MRVVEGADEARRTILRREHAEATEVPGAVAETLERVFGRRVSPEEAVRCIIDDVRKRGDEALAHYNRALDGVSSGAIEVDHAEIEAAWSEIPSELADALRFAAGRIREYHEEQRRHAAQSFFNNGRGQQVTAVERVGMYVPGTSVVYPSSVLMTAIPARVAGVGELFMATPAGPDGSVSPLKLAAADLAGVDRVFRIGGAQAIAALAIGTETVPRVDKICGPGGLFVTLAKQMVYGQVGIDSVYGPSETIVVADESADPVLSAADLLAQAEHDELANPILLATSREVVDRTLQEVEKQLATLPRGQIARNALERQGGAVIVASIDEAVMLANEYAPEHLCLNVSAAERYLSAVKHAGAVFVGEGSPEAIGDYTAGPSHVMPTGRAARFSGALGVHDFLKITSVINLDGGLAASLARQGAVIAQAEGFTGHAAAMERRLDRQDGAR